MGDTGYCDACGAQHKYIHMLSRGGENELFWICCDCKKKEDRPIDEKTKEFNEWMAEVDKMSENRHGKKPVEVYMCDKCKTKVFEPIQCCGHLTPRYVG